MNLKRGVGPTTAAHEEPQKLGRKLEKRATLVGKKLSVEKGYRGLNAASEK